MSSDSRPISRSLVKNAGPLLGAGAAAKPRPGPSPAPHPAIAPEFDDDRGGLVVDRVGPEASVRLLEYFGHEVAI